MDGLDGVFIRTEELIGGPEDITEVIVMDTTEDIARVPGLVMQPDHETQTGMYITTDLMVLNKPVMSRMPGHQIT